MLKIYIYVTKILKLNHIKNMQLVLPQVLKLNKTEKFCMLIL